MMLHMKDLRRIKQSKKSDIQHTYEFGISL